MNFSLTPEQAAVQQRARLVAQEVKAQAAQNDRESRFPRDILEIWAKEGFFGLSLPREYGGQGRDTNEIMRLIIARDLLKGE